MSAGVNKAPRGQLQRSQSLSSNARPLPNVPTPNQPQRGGPNPNNRGSPGGAPRERLGTAPPPPMAPHPLDIVTTSPSTPPAQPQQLAQQQPQPNNITKNHAGNPNNPNNPNPNKNGPMRGSPLASSRGNSDSSLPINNRGNQRGGPGGPGGPGPGGNPMQKRGSAPALQNARGGPNQSPQQRGARGALRASNSLRSVSNDRGKPPQQQQKRRSGSEISANNVPPPDSKPQNSNPDSEEAEDLEKKRLFVVRELVDTERSYSKSLNLLVQLYVEPLGKALTSEKVILPQDQMYIFDNLAVMAKISEQLLADLEEELSKWDTAVKNGVGDSSSLCISGVFKKILPFMRMYSSYRTQVDFNHLHDLYDQYPKFGDYCSKMFLDPRSCGQTLDSLLIMPIQRIPRYILLLETYLKYTDSTFSDYSGLQEALSLVKDVAGHVNSASHAEMDNTMFSLCIRFGDAFNELVEPWRTYISEIKLKQVNGTKKKTMLLLLLNDHVVFATGKKKNKYKGKLELIECWVADISNNEENENLFVLFHPLSQYTFSCDSSAQKTHWVALIASTIEKIIQDPRGGSERRIKCIDEQKMASMRGTHEFYKQPTKAQLTQEEFNLLKTILVEQAPPEKEKERDRSSKMDLGDVVPSNSSEEKLREPSPLAKSKSVPKIKNKQIKQIQSTMNQQKKLSLRASTLRGSMKKSFERRVDVVKQGELTKKGAIVKNWKDRYWILSTQYLSYYKSETDAEPVGEIELDGCEVRDPREDNEDKCCFELVAPQRTYYLRAATAELCKEWAQAIENQITALHPSGNVKEGYLIKQGKVRKNWKKRYCILSGTNLNYYRQKSDPKPAGSIEIKNTKIAPVNKKECGKSFCFGVDTGSRVFWMCAETPALMDEWVACLTKIAQT